jgi:uncharacterized protein (DUF1697 family)
MTVYIAFLRAINVGGHVVKMEQLCQLFEAVGLSNVETFINSGNVIFESRAAKTSSLEKKIENHLLKSLGYEVATFVRSAAELAAIATYQPFISAGPDAAGETLYIAFTHSPPSHEPQQKLMAFQTKLEEFHVHEREVYWLTRTSFSQSAFSGALLEKTLGRPATFRNSTTVRKLAAKYPAVRRV